MSSTPLTEGIGYLIRDSIKVSIQNDSLDTFIALNTFVRSVIQLSIKNNSLHNFQEYINTPIINYSLSHQRVKENPQNIQNYKHISKNTILTIKEVIIYDLGFYINKNILLEDLINFNKFYVLSFTAYNDLLSLLVKNIDIPNFNLAILELNQIQDPTFGKSEQLELSISELENAEATVDRKNYLKELNKTIVLRHNTLIGIKSWIFYLYKKKVINEVTLKELLAVFKNRQDTYFSIKDILTLRKEQWKGYLGWSYWDYIDRPTNEFYTPPNPSNWLTFGFLIEQIFTESSYIHLEQLELDELSSIQFLYDDLSRYCKYLENDFDNWKTVFNLDSIEVLKGRCNKVLAVFEFLMKKESTEKGKAIADAEIDSGLVENFKELVGRTWIKQARIRNLFNQIGNTKTVVEPNTKLENVKLHNFLERGKIMFIKNTHNHQVFNIDVLGGLIAKKENDFFFYSILKEYYNRIYGDGIIDVIEKAILKIKNSGFKATVILISPELTSESSDLDNDKRFNRGTKINQIFSEQPLLGYFDDVPLLYSYSEYLRGKLLVCDFKEAFEMLNKEVPDGYLNLLKVSVKDITEENAKLRLEADYAKWVKLEDAGYILEEDRINYVRTCVEIDIETQVEFKVLNRDAFLIGSIKSEK